MARPRKKKPELDRERSPSEVGDILDIDPETIRRWCNLRKGEKCPHTKRPDGNFGLNEAEVMGWMKRTNHTGKGGRPSHTSPNIEGARLRKENALADRYELATAKERGQLLVAADVEAEWVSEAVALRTALQNYPQQIVALSLSHGMPHEGAAEYERQATDLMNGILRQFSKGDEDEPGADNQRPEAA